MTTKKLEEYIDKTPDYDHREFLQFVSNTAKPLLSDPIHILLLKADHNIARMLIKRCPLLKKFVTSNNI